MRQHRELAEIFGFETRNKYVISTPDREELFYAAEQSTGLLGVLGRQLLGHWRTFDIAFFTPDRREALRAHHPFRFWLQRLEIHAGGRFIGALQQRLTLFTKRFDVLDASGRVVCEMRSGLFQIWTYPFFRKSSKVAVIEKRWSGLLSEMFTDKDNFRLTFHDPHLTVDERLLMLASAVFVDLQYFERKAD